MRVQSKSRLHSDEKTIDIECLKHDLSHLLSIFWRVHGWLGQDEVVLFRFTADVRVNRFVPKFLNSFPVGNLTRLKERSCIIFSIVDILSLVSNEEI